MTSIPIFGSWLTASVVVGLSGPFGTYLTLSLVDRLAFWSLVFALSVPFGFLTRLLMLRITPGPMNLAGVLFQAFLFTVLYFPVLNWCTSGLSDGSSSLPDWALFTAVFVSSLCVTMLRIAIDPPVRQGPRLAQRLDLPEHVRILRISAKDHFVSVHCDDGQVHRVRMRFSDAVNEMEGVSGFCSHRSHWVARRAITGAERVGSREVLHVRDGGEVPIGRKYRPDLVAAGVL
ncbi:LytTR family DNA-binding domain-containing protein [Aestuariibius insulae]